MPTDRKSLEAAIEATENELQALRETIKRSTITTPEQQERIEALFAKMDALYKQYDREELPAANEPKLEEEKIA